MLSSPSPPQLPRILTVCMTVVLLLALMAPAVFADSYDSFVFETVYGDLTPIDNLIPEGLYDISFYFEVDGIVFTLCSVVPVDIVYGDLGEGLYGFLQEVNFFVEYEGERLEILAIVFLGKLGGTFCKFMVEGSQPEGILTFTLVPDSSAVSQFLVYTTTTLSSVVSWFGSLIDSFIGENGALSVLFPFVAIGFTIALVYIGIKLVRQFVPGF